MTADNPYYHRGPIRDPKHFHGRVQLVEDAMDYLRRNQSVSIVGPRKVGKTSLLFYLANPEVMSSFGLSPQEYMFVHLDCEGLGDLNRAAFYRLILEEVREKLSERGLDPAIVQVPESEEITYVAFDRAIRGVHREGLKLVLLFDEFERMTFNPNLDMSFFTSLRGLSGKYNLAYVTASKQPLIELTYAHKVLTSPFFNIFTTCSLGLFSEEEARQFISGPSSKTGIMFSPESLQFVMEIAGRFPLFLQIACFNVFKLQTQRDHLEQADYRALRERIQEELTGHFKYYWEDLSVEEKQALVTLSEVQDDESWAETLRSLRQKGLIISRYDGYDYLSTTWADFVRRQLVEPEIVENTLERKVPSYPEAGLQGRCALAIDFGEWSHHLSVEVEESINYRAECQHPLHMDERELAVYEEELKGLYHSPNWKFRAKRIGQDLHRKLVFTQPIISEAFNVSLGRVRRGQDLSLSFRLPRQMLSLPVELLHDDRDWLGLVHPLSKYVMDLRIKRAPLCRELWEEQELKVLLLAANMAGCLEPLPGVDEESEGLRELFDRLCAEGVHCRLDCLASWEASHHRVREALGQGRYHILHYMGHGQYNPAQPEESSLFLWDDEEEAVRPMPAAEFKMLIQDSDLRFAYFSCCEGAAQASGLKLLDNDFLGIVDAALEAGLPAALGMRWPVRDDSAKIMALAFYEALFQEGSLDVAMLKARQSIASRDREDITWLSPILVVQR